jgi:DNA repair protein SbcD/Mre11
MRALHTSDWHIGVRKNGLDRTRDHDHVFAQIKALAIAERVEVIINTGDTFDEANPGIETLRYGWSILEELANIAPLVVVCGNHDSAKLLELMGTILKTRLPIYFIDPSTFQKQQGGIVQIANAAGEIIKIGAVPFIKSQSFIRQYVERDPARATVTYADDVGSIERRVGTWLNEGYDPTRDIRIFAAHLLVDGAQVSGSEYRVYVDSDFATKPENIPSADYVAFGHIHKPQPIAGIDHGRYAGSPLQIDFGEITDQKSVFLISGKPGYALDIEAHPLDIGRRLVDVRGTLDEISKRRDEFKNTIARVIVSVDGPVSDLEARVREMLADTIVCQVKGKYPETLGNIAIVTPGADDREPTLNEMFANYLALQPNAGNSALVKRYFDVFLDRVESGTENDRSFADIDEVVA